MVRSRMWGYAAAGWGVLFAALHFFWALGGSAGLAASAGVELATERPDWFVAVGLWGVGLLLLAATGLAITLARGHHRGWRRHALVLGGTAVGVLLLVRGIGVEVLLLSGALDGNAQLEPEQRHWTLVLWNPWFVVGGLAFVLAALGLLRRVPST